MSGEAVVQQEMQGEVKEMSAVERIIGIFFKPKKVFEYLRQKPKWILPFIIMCCVAVLSNVLVKNFAIQEQIERVQMSDRLSDEQKDQVVKNLQESNTGAKAFIGIIMTPVFLLLVLIIVSAVLLFCGNTIMGGQATFRQMLGMYAHVGLIGLPAAIVKIPIMLAQQSTHVQTSLAAVMPSEADKTLLYKLLAKLDVFTIWEVILLVIGIAVVYRFTNRKAATLVLVLWAVWIAISLTLGSLIPGFGLA